MRIQQLDLIAYGPFTGTQLDFGSANECGLHLVYGPNEAGKSSALTAVLDFLFGFPNRSASTFQTSGQKVRVGATVAHGGHQHALIRRKGRKDTLLSAASGEPFHADVLETYLQGIDRKRFESEFGISYAQLVAGGRELANGKGDLASALFAVATGSQRWLKTRRTLEEEARKLFLSRGSVPKINALIETLDSQKKKLGQLQLLPHDWDRRQSDLAESESRWKQAEQHWLDLQERVKQIEYTSKLKPLLQDYQLTRTDFLAKQIEWLPNDDDFDQWERWIDLIEQDLARVTDCKNRLQKLLQQLETPLNVSSLEAGDGLDRLVEGKNGLVQLTRSVSETMALHLELRERYENQRSEWLARLESDQWANMQVETSTADSGEVVADQHDLPNSNVQQTMFWEEDAATASPPTRKTADVWYETELTTTDQRKLDQLAEQLVRAEVAFVEASNTLLGLQQKLSDLDAPNGNETRGLLTDAQAEFTEQFLADNAALLGTLTLQEEMQRRCENLMTEGKSALAENAVLSQLDLAEIWNTDWAALLDHSSWYERWLAIRDERHELKKTHQALTARLNELNQQSEEDEMVGDQAYQLWLQFLNRSTGLVTRELTAPGEIGTAELQLIVGELEDVFPDLAAGIPSGDQPGVWLAEIHRWLIDRVLELNQSRVDRSDELAAIRQRVHERSQLKERLAVIEVQIGSLEESAAALDQQWLQHIESLPITISISDLKDISAALQGLQLLGRQHQELQNQLSDGLRETLPVVQKLENWCRELQLVDGLTDSGAPESGCRVERKEVERQWQLLKNLLTDWRKAKGQNQQRQIQLESIRQRIAEAQATVSSAKTDLDSKSRLWRDSLYSTGLPERMSGEQFQEWRAVQNAFDEIQAQRRDVFNRIDALKKSMLSYTREFDSVAAKLGGTSSYRELLGSFSPDAQQDFSAWNEKWLIAQQEILQAVDHWKTERLEAQAKSVQRQQWQLQQRELEVQLQELSDSIGGNIERLLGQLQRVGPAFRLKEDLVVDDLPLEQLRLLGSELKAKVLSVENLLADASLLDSRLEAIQKIQGSRMLSGSFSQPFDEGQVQATEENEGGSVDAGELQQLQAKLAEQKKITQELADQLAVKRREIQQLQKRTEAVEMQQAIEMNLAELSDLCDQYLEYSLSAVLLDETMTRHSQQNQHPILAKASDHFAKLTLGSFRGLKTEMDSNGRKLILGERRDMSTVEVDGMSEGTETQLYLALRISALEHFLSGGTQLPFVVDDVLKDYDDQRALAALKLFAEVGQKTQVILFTHHQHLLDLVQNNLPATEFQVHHLQSGHAQTTG